MLKIQERKKNSIKRMEQKAVLLSVSRHLVSEHPLNKQIILIDEEAAAISIWKRNLSGRTESKNVSAEMPLTVVVPNSQHDE